MKTSHNKENFRKSYDADVAVVGGGVTGVVAAIAAARLGAKTLLVNNRPVLGGVSSSECIFNANGNHVCGASEYVNRNARETGIMEELRLEARFLEANGWARHWSMVLRDFCAREKNLILLLNTEVYAVKVEKQKIKGITARTINSETTVEICSQVFIDCSGDSFLGFSAGAEYRMGRESQKEFGESLAPEKADAKTMGSSIQFQAIDVGSPVSFKAPSWAYKIESDKDLPYRIHNNPGNGWWWLEYGGELDTIADNEQIYGTLLGVLYGIWDHIKNDRSHNADNLVINWVSNMTGKRESRRVIGDYILTQNDVTGHPEFPDAVAYGGWPIDIHPPEGVFGKSHPGSTPPFIFPGVYEIPFRCLYSKNINNLLVAGRNISVSHVALGTTRVTATCALCGQAAGSAAYLAVRHKTTPREIGKKYIDELKYVLAMNDAEMPRNPYKKIENLAARSHITASSSMYLKILESDSLLPLTALPKNTNEPASEAYDPCDEPPLDRSRAQMFPVVTKRLDAVTIIFNSEKDCPTLLTARLRQSPIFNKFDSTVDLVVAQSELPPGRDKPVKFYFNINTEPGTLYWISIDPEPQVSVCTSSRYLPGIYMKSDGCYFDDRNFCFEIFPAQNIFEAENAINGISRAGNRPNMWISDPQIPLPQFIELDFGNNIEFNSVELIFDTNLNRLVKSGVAPESVRDYDLLAITDDSTILLEKISNNYQRRRVHAFAEKISAKKIKVVINTTNGDKSARIYEARVFLK